ncbi:MAG: C40 family peptidase [Leucobacter sp.]|nr:C40 family peptidase [Leucobacter sp.]
MHQTPGSEIALKVVSAPRKRSYKQVVKAAGAGIISAAMVGIFALPVYAATEPLPDAETAHAQLLSTVSSSTIAVPAHLPSAEEQPIVVEAAIEEEVFAVASFSIDIPAGAGAQGIVDGAYSQLGIGQDCTDLVQNSLSALGLVTPRLHGGPDLGTSVGTWAQFGYVVSDGSYAPGDILIWPGYHVAIYVGNGMAVHGGWTNGGRHAESTVLTGAFATGAPSAVVRVA